MSDMLRAPFDTSVPAALAAACDPGDALDPTTGLSDLFTPAFLASAQVDIGATMPAGCWLRESSLTVSSIPRITPSSPSYGILWVVGSEDRLIHPPIERASYDTLCAAGTPLQYLECEGASHTRATAWAIPELFAFLDARPREHALHDAVHAPRSNALHGHASVVSHLHAVVHYPITITLLPSDPDARVSR